MFAAVWINNFAHAQRHREPLAESFKNLANDSKESVHWEPVLNKIRFSIPIPTGDRDCTQVKAKILGHPVLGKRLIRKERLENKTTLGHQKSTRNKI